MKLTKNWLTENLVDFEYKKYQLLAYLQEVKENYSHSKIYPWLAEVIDHYRHLVTVKRTADDFLQLQKGALKGINWKKMELQFEKGAEDSELMQEIRLIIDYAIPLLTQHIDEGKSIYDLVEENLKLRSVGISPLKNDEGYLFLRMADEARVSVFMYQLSFFTQQGSECQRILKTEFNGTYEVSISFTYEKLKRTLIEKNKDLPNPAVYSIDCSMQLPVQETLLPVAKRYFVSRIAA